MKKLNVSSSETVNRGCSVETVTMADPEPPRSNKSPLYEAVTCIIGCALQSDNSLQKVANDRLQQIEVIEEYPVVLCEIICNDEESGVERHLGAVFLKNYLEDVFTHQKQNKALYEKSYGKNIILQLIENMGTKDASIREMIACNVALLLGLGFWNDVTILLNDMVKSEDPVQIADAVYILHKAIDAKFLENHEHGIIEHHWFDVLIDVLKMKTVPSLTRMHSVHPMFMLIKYLRPNQNYVPDCLGRLSEETGKALNEPYSVISDFAFKCEVLRCVNKSVEEFNEYCNIVIPPVLPAVGNLLTKCCDQFKKVVRGSDRPPKDVTELDEPKNFFQLISAILEFIFSLIDMTYFDVLIEDLDNLIYCVYVFMACHNDMERYLYSDIVEKDHHWSLRDTCAQIITYTVEKLDSRQSNGKALYFKTVHNVFQRLNSELEPQQHSDLYKVYYMSRITESMIFGTGLIKERYVASDPEFPFPLDYYLNHWSSLLSHCNLMLQGRILWIGGIYCTRLTSELMECHFKYILQHLNGDNKYLLIPSAEALCNYLKEFKGMTPEKQFIISRVAKQILDLLVSISRKLNRFPLHHSLNALGYLIKSHKDLARENIDQLEDILIRTVVNSISDPCVMKEVYFICVKIAQVQGFKILLHDKFLTFLQHLVHSLEPRHLRHDLDKAFDILNTICLYSPVVDEYLILQTFMGAASRLGLNTDRDVEIDESAGSLLITLITKLPNQLKFIHQMPKGQPVIGGFPQLLEMLLQPDGQLPRNILGKLVIVTIFSLPELMEPHYETILRNVVTSTAKHNVKKLRATWSIFIFICMLRTSDTLNYLSVLPGPNGGSALNFMMKLWQPEYFHNIAPIERKILVLSMCHIVQHCLENESDRAKMEEVAIPFDRPNQESPTGEIFTGVEYLYYLLIQCLIYEDKLQKIEPPRAQPYDFEDFGEDASTRREEDDIFLFHSHPFNINVIEHIVNFLKTGSEPYYSVVKRFIPQASCFRLRELGCNVPEQEMNVQEDME